MYFFTTIDPAFFQIFLSNGGSVENIFQFLAFSDPWYLNRKKEVTRAVGKKNFRGSNEDFSYINVYTECYLEPSLEPISERETLKKEYSEIKDTLLYIYI